MSYAKAREISAEEIPVIDVAGLSSGDPDATLRIGREMRRASETIGFFYVRNHGIAPALLERAFATSKRFFEVAPEQKREVGVNELHRGYIGLGGAKMVGEKKTDLKESFVWGLELPPDDPDVAADKPLMGPNQWPGFAPELQRDLYGYFCAALDCGRRLMQGLAASLDRPTGFFDKAFAKPLARAGTIYYPPQAPAMGEGQFGVAPHTDYGGLTLLAQDEVGGLQVRSKDGEWLTARPIPGTLVINVGDLLGRWTNDRFNSNAHRVVNTAARERQSIAVFFDPHFDTVIDPRDLLDDPGEARYPPVTCGEYILDRFGKVFAYRQSAT
jgi:isopenicillin N synthase-like dioxygenase